MAKVVKPKAPTIKIVRREVPTDPSIEIFTVEIGDDRSTWAETIPSEEALRWFLRGVQAGGQAYANTYVSLPEVPRKAIALDT